MPLACWLLLGGHHAVLASARASASRNQGAEAVFGWRVGGNQPAETVRPKMIELARRVAARMRRAQGLD